MENIKLCETCNIRNTKKKNGKFCQICLSARNNAKLKGSGYYKDYYQNNKDKFVKAYNKKGLRPDARAVISEAILSKTKKFY